MKKVSVLISFIVTIIILIFVVVWITTTNNSIIIKNDIFSLSFPKNVEGTYSSDIQKDSILIYHEKSRLQGFGGFAFGIKIYKNPSDYAEMPGSKKIGELTDINGELYDVVLLHPTDVQYDYTENSEAPHTFKVLYNLYESNNLVIKGVNGTIFFKDQGTKGSVLYKDILKKHIKAVNEKWDKDKLESQKMSYMYDTISSFNNDTSLSRIGYIYYDVNVDGIEELIVGEIAEKEWKGIIYDIYTVVDRKVQHVISGGDRNRFFVCDGSLICNEYSNSAYESGLITYALIENSVELLTQISFKYDENKNSKKPYFIRYASADNEWENVSEEVFKERKSIFNKYERFDYIPLSSYKEGK